jgi:hypothetical protein
MKPRPTESISTSSILAGAVTVSVPVSKSQPVSEAEGDGPIRSQPVDPRRNPSYPQRIHVHERAHWQAELERCEAAIARVRPKLDSLRNSPNRAAFERLFAQMLGARDQVADAARRLPMETGSLYEEDRHRLEEGLAAMERVVKQWETLTA